MAAVFVAETDAAWTVLTARPSRAALERYRQATDLMKSAVLPAVASLTKANVALLDHTYQGKRGGAQHAMIWVALLGALLLAALLGLQIFLARRTHRLLNPPLALATALVAVFTVAGAGLFRRSSR